MFSSSPPLIVEAPCRVRATEVPADLMSLSSRLAAEEKGLADCLSVFELRSGLMSTSMLRGTGIEGHTMDAAVHNRNKNEGEHCESFRKLPKRFRPLAE